MLKFFVQVSSLILTISLLLYSIFFATKINFLLPLILVIILFVESVILNGYRRVDKRDWKLKLPTIFGFTFLFQCLWYLIGVKTGYTSNLNFIPRGYVLIQNVISILLLLVVREILRYNLVNTRTRNNYQYILLQILNLLLCVTIDLYLAPKRYVFTSFAFVYEFFALFLVPSMSKNIFLNYVSKKFGYVATFIYIFVMDLNIYYLPECVDMDMLIESAILLIFPYVLYSYFNSLEEKNKVEPKRLKKESKLLNCLSIIVFAILVGLVSRKFMYAAIGIGSESMTGSINKGDAVVYKRYEENEDVKGKIIVFNKDDRFIVHRVVRSYIVDGQEVYQTKGDYNDSMDRWLVNSSEIVGVVEFRIPLVAWPSVLLSELF